MYIIGCPCGLTPFGIEILNVTCALIFRVRTSSGTFLRRGRDKIIRNIEKRIADFTFIPVGKCFEGIHFYVLLVDKI